MEKIESLSDKLKNRPFISAVLPVYNVEKYIAECLDSLIQQDVAEQLLEIICIDDGSTDNSRQILDDYAKAHTNIVVIHQQNMGVSDARNVGIRLARGKYIWFVDSDDFVIYNVLSGIVDAIESDYPDALLVNSVALYDGINTERIKSGALPEKSEIVRESKHWIPTWYINKDVIINSGVRFYPKIYLGDKLFIDMLKPYIKTIKCYDKLVYCYRIRKDSITTKPINKKVHTLINSCRAFKEVWEQDRIEYETTMKTLFMLMTKIMNYLSGISRKEARPYIKELSQYKLYPSKDLLNYYKKQKSNARNNMSTVKKLRNISYTRVGYNALRLLKRLRKS